MLPVASITVTPPVATITLIAPPVASITVTTPIATITL